MNANATPRRRTRAATTSRIKYAHAALIVPRIAPKIPIAHAFTRDRARAGGAGKYGSTGSAAGASAGSGAIGRNIAGSSAGQTRIGPAPRFFVIFRCVGLTLAG